MMTAYSALASIASHSKK